MTTPSRVLSTVLAAAVTAVPLAAAPLGGASAASAHAGASAAAVTRGRPAAGSTPTKKKASTSTRRSRSGTARATARPSARRGTAATSKKRAATKKARSAAARTAAARRASTRGRVVRSGKVAYLTFDDGPTATYTPQVLAILRRHHAKATFFMVGRQAAARPDLVRKVRAEGHAVGNHSWDHPNLATMSPAGVLSQLTRTDKALGHGVRCVRPPYGATNPTVSAAARRVQERVVLWNVDTRDWARPGVASITRAATSFPSSSSPTILFHDGGGPRTQTVAALPGVLDTLAKRGYRFEALPACR